MIVFIAIVQFCKVKTAVYRKFLYPDFGRAYQLMEIRLKDDDNRLGVNCGIFKRNTGLLR